MNNSFVFVLLAVFLGFQTQAFGDAIVKPNETQKNMQKFMHELTALKKFMVSDEKFNDKKNAPEISRRLKEFARLTKESKHDPKLGNDAFKFSRHALEDHMVNTERVFRLGSKSFARWQLAATTAVCLSCHSQAPTKDQAFGDFLDDSIFSSQTDKAEFLFATKSFQKASDLNSEIILGFPKNKISSANVENAIERQVAYFARIKKDPAAAIEKLKAYKNNPELPNSLKKNIDLWISQFETLAKQPKIDVANSSAEQVLKIARKNLDIQWTEQSMEASNPHLANYLYTSGLLYEYLQTHPRSNSTPEILYWLAVVDRASNNNFFFSLADLYLRECIVTYPANPMAKKCLKEFEQEMLAGYSGSSGLHLPEDVRTEIERLRKHIEGGGKLELNKQ